MPAMSRALNETPSQSYGMSLVIWMALVIWDQCYLPPDTSEHTPPYPSHRPVLDLPAPEGWKAELT